MIVHDFQQGTAEWHKARSGIPTASMFATVMASGKGGGPSLTRKTYLYKLAGEIVTGEPSDNFSNAHMERGHDLEPEARDLYAFSQRADPRIVGFITNGRKGCSPDSLIGDAGMLEIKTKLPHLLIEAMLRDDAPPEHRAQCQGALWVAEREWIDLAIYWPGLPLVIHRITRDEAYIKALSEAVDAFNAELDEIVARVRAYGSGAALEAA